MNKLISILAIAVIFIFSTIGIFVNDEMKISGCAVKLISSENDTLKYQKIKFR